MYTMNSNQWRRSSQYSYQFLCFCKAFQEVNTPLVFIEDFCRWTTVNRDKKIITVNYQSNFIILTQLQHSHKVSDEIVYESQSGKYSESPEVTPYTTNTCLFELVWPNPVTFKMSFFKSKSGIQEQSRKRSSLLGNNDQCSYSTTRNVLGLQ